MPIVYKVTNKSTGRGYIGHTVRSLEERWRGHLSSSRHGSNFRFHSAIRKYGEADWDLEVLVESDSIDHIRKEEERLINHYKFTTKGIGYNAKPGGCGGWIVPADKYQQWLMKQRNNSAGVNNSQHCGLSDSDILQCIYECLQYIDRDNTKSRSLQSAIKLSAELYNTPKSFSRCRFVQFEGGSHRRVRLALINEYGPDIEQLLKRRPSKKQRDNASGLMSKMLKERYKSA